MQMLAKHIISRLQTHLSCVVFESQLERVFPTDENAKKKRAAAIQAFARENGWSVKITDPGVRATFRKL